MGSSPELVDQHLVVNEAEQIRVYGRPMEIEQGNRAADGVVEEMRLIGVRAVLGAANLRHPSRGNISRKAFGRGG